MNSNVAGNHLSEFNISVYDFNKFIKHFWSLFHNSNNILLSKYSFFNILFYYCPYKVVICVIDLKDADRGEFEILLNQATQSLTIEPINTVSYEPGDIWFKHIDEYLLDFYVGVNPETASKILIEYKAEYTNAFQKEYHKYFFNLLFCIQQNVLNIYINPNLVQHKVKLKTFNDNFCGRIQKVLAESKILN